MIDCILTGLPPLEPAPINGIAKGNRVKASAQLPCGKTILGDRYASMYSATDDGSGMDSPSSRIPSRCMRIASRIRSSTSAWVAPVATQPGKSGENADKLFGVFSMTIRYLVCMVLVLESGLPQDAVKCAGSNVILRMASNAHPSRFGGMFVLAMAALPSNHDPTVVFDYTQNFTNSHDSPFFRSPNDPFSRRTTKVTGS
jgi:hypothetical protein